MAINLAATPAAAPGMDNLNRVVGQSGALVSCLDDGRKLLVRQRRFGQNRGQSLNTTTLIETFLPSISMFVCVCVSGLTVCLRLVYFGWAGHAPSAPHY